MDNTKKSENYSGRRKAKTTVNNETREVAIPSSSKELYFDIANSVHGIGIGKNDGREGEETLIKIELCEWRIPPISKKKDCLPVKCTPIQEG